LHPKLVAGRPDFYFESGRIAVFVDGCFWHGCSRCGHVPQKNRPFWIAKLTRNRERDRAAERALRAEGVTVVRFWEHELAESLPSCVRRLQELLARTNSRSQNASTQRRRQSPSSIRRPDAP
jgi:DNA mismatch endonuclease (patch repair protein)